MLLKYLLYTVIFFVFFSAKVLGELSPCFFGFYIAMLFVGESSFYLPLSYFFALILSGATTPSIISSLFCSFIVISAKLIHKKQNRHINSLIASLYAIVSSLSYIYFNLSSLTSIYIAFINVFLNVIFMLCSFNFLKIIKMRNCNLNLNTDEIVYGCISLALVFCGLQNLNVFSFDIVKLFGIAILVFSSSILPNNGSIVLSVVMGLGACLCNGEMGYITLFSVMSIMCQIFKNYSKVYCVLMTVLIDLTFNLFLNLFGQFNIFNILPTIIICLSYMLLPNNIILKLKNTLFLSSDNSSLKTILNQNKTQVSKKLLYTAEVFYEMNKNFRKLVKGGLDQKNAKLMICSEVIRCNCESCSQKIKCLKGFNSELKKIFENLINSGFEKGKVTLVDLPPYLINRCTKLNQLVTSINSLLSEYKQYSKMIGDVDCSKLLIAEQLGGISDILTNLSKETSQKVNMDYQTEKLIKETLVYNDIVPSEVVCFEKDEKTNVISLILRSADFDNEKIVNIINKICSSKMVMDECLPNADSNLTYVSYKTAPAYNIAVGFAQAKKGGQEVCGDTHTLSKLNNDKFLFAICDGMGNGDKANKASELSISLIENFYKAGFDNQTILTSVNKLLNLGKQDVFSALDISVVDLKNGEIDFIKQGATNGYIKKGQEINQIESSNLPLGILEDIKPKVTKTVLTADDTVIMISDGISDAFGENENLINYLKSLPSNNPQDIADKILYKAKNQQKGYPEDDMTVLVGKLFYNFG